MAGGSKRSAEKLHQAKSSAEGRRGQAGHPAEGAGRSAPVVDRVLILVVTTLTVALLAISRYAIGPTGELGWSWPLLLLCVLVAAVAGRALLGERREDRQAEPSTRRATAVVWALLLAAAILPNLRTLGMGFFADDFGLLRAAALLNTPLDVFQRLPLRIFYRPMSLLVWWLGLHLWGGAALGYHLFSVALHTGNTALVYLLARRYTKGVFSATMGALLFALHPVHVEATSWPSAQPDLLCTGFVLLSMLCLERYLTATSSRQRSLALTAGLAAFLLAVLSKETAAVLPGVVLVRLLVIPDQKRWGRALTLTGAYALTAAAYLGLRFAVLGPHWLGGYGVDVGGSQAGLSPAPLLLLGELLFPLHITLINAVLSPYLWLLAVVLAGAALIWFMRNLVFVSWSHLALYAAYLLVPTIPIAMAGLMVGEEMANSRYAYLPSVGLAFLFGEICARRGRRPARSRAACLAIVCAAAVLSFWYVEPWRGAARFRDHLLAEGVRIVNSLPESPPPSMVYITGIPFAYLGAPVFVEGCYAAALSPLVNIAVEDVAPTPARLGVMGETKLLPGQYVANWDQETQRLVITRAG